MVVCSRDYFDTNAQSLPQRPQRGQRHLTLRRDQGQEAPGLPPPGPRAACFRLNRVWTSGTTATSGPPPGFLCVLFWSFKVAPTMATTPPGTGRRRRCVLGQKPRCRDGMWGRGVGARCTGHPWRTGPSTHARPLAGQVAEASGPERAAGAPPRGIIRTMAKGKKNSREFSGRRKQTCRDLINAARVSSDQVRSSPCLSVTSSVCPEPSPRSATAGRRGRKGMGKTGRQGVTGFCVTRGKMPADWRRLHAPALRSRGAQRGPRRVPAPCPPSAAPAGGTKARGARLHASLGDRAMQTAETMDDCNSARGTRRSLVKTLNLYVPMKRLRRYVPRERN